MENTSIEDLRSKVSNTLGISDHSEFFAAICNILEEQQGEIEILKGKTFYSAAEDEKFFGTGLDKLNTFLIEIANNNNIGADKKGEMIREFLNKLGF